MMNKVNEFQRTAGHNIGVTDDPKSCSKLLYSLRDKADWFTVQHTIGNNHSTLIGVFVSWYLRAFPQIGTVIEGAPSFSSKGEKIFKSDALFCQGEKNTVIGILEVEGTKYIPTIKKIRKHFASKNSLLSNLRFAIFVVYPALPKGSGLHRNFPSAIGDTELKELEALSKDYPDKCILVINLTKKFERKRSEIRKKTEYYSGLVTTGTAKLYKNGEINREFSFSLPLPNKRQSCAHLL